MRDKYCLPIMAEAREAVLSTILENVDSYGFFEVWLDYVKEADAEWVKSLDATYPGRIVYVFRRQRLEPMKMPLTERLDIIRALSGSGSYVDLDTSHQKKEFDAIASEKLKIEIIGSYHNYDETPIDDELYDVAADISRRRVRVIKMSCMCSTEEDAVRLLELALNFREQGQKYIVSGMGQKGLVTRVFGSLWGNELIFAPRSEDELSAPGELTRDHLEGIFRLLGL